MKRFTTLSAVAALALASLGAQAQFTVDGTLSPAEIGTGAGKYQLVGTYTGAHSVTDRGLSALYVGTTATTLNVMVVASPEQAGYSALLLYLDMPNKTGVAAGTQLPAGSDGSSQLQYQPTLDMPADYGFRLTASPLGDAGNAVYHSKIDYTAALVNGKAPDTYLGTTNKSGMSFTITDAASGVAGGKVAYQTGATGSVAANTTTGWEFEYPLAALGGANANDVLHLMVAYIGDHGPYYSDTLPGITGQTADLGATPNFSTIPGNQNYAYQVGTGVLAARTGIAPNLQAAAYPNPVTAASQLAYVVPGGPQSVSLDVYNNLGQKTMSLLNATQAAGAHTAALAPVQKLAPGAYLVLLRVGTQLSTHRVVVE